MLKRLSQKEQITNLLDQFSLSIRQAFLDVIAAIRSKITLGLIITRLERGDIQGAIEAMNIERSAFNPVLDEIGKAFSAGGNSAVDNLPILRDPQGHRVVLRFDVRNPAAEQWLRDHSSTLATNIVEDQRTAIRQALTEGLSRGDNPRRTALAVVGRVNRATGRREGGVIGLTSTQERAAARAREELASGEPDQIRAYLGRARRDKRFDKMITAAAREGKRLDNATVDRIVGRYSDRLLQLRGEMLGRTETLTALNTASDHAMTQAIQSGKVAQTSVTSVWRSAGDDRVRHTHQVLNGESVPYGQAFTSPSGARMRFPGDTSLGAPGAEVIGCRCYVFHRVDFLASFRQN